MDDVRGDVIGDVEHIVEVREAEEEAGVDFNLDATNLDGSAVVDNGGGGGDNCFCCFRESINRDCVPVPVILHRRYLNNGFTLSDVIGEVGIWLCSLTIVIFRYVSFVSLFIFLRNTF